MASIHARQTASGRRWDVRYRTPDGVLRKKTFVRKADAAAFASTVEADKLRGTYIDQNAGKVAFERYALGWLEMQTFDEMTRYNVGLRLHKHVFPVIGGMQLRQLRPSVMQSWVRSLDSLAPTYQRVLFGHVVTILSAAVDDGLIPKNPCKASSVKRPAPPDRKVVPWPSDWVRGVHDALGDRYGIAVTLGAGLGLRQGELLGLSPDDLDIDEGVVQVQRQVKRAPDGSLTFAPPKGRKTRTVPLPETVQEEVAAQVKRHPATPVTLPWERRGGELITVRLIVTNSRGNAFHAWRFNETHWQRALDAVGIPGDRENGCHALRHYFASVLLDAGESILAVSEYLGHADPSFTLRTYTHLMPSSHERTRKAVDAAFRSCAIAVPSPALGAAGQEPDSAPDLRLPVSSRRRRGSSCTSCRCRRGTARCARCAPTRS